MAGQSQYRTFAVFEIVNAESLMTMKDRKVVDAFVEYLRGSGYPNLQVDRRPDEKNRDSPDIDAIAGNFAIEHTSVDMLPNQRRDSDWFMHATGGLEQELSGKLSFRFNVTLEYKAISKGQKWDKIRQSLKAWISSDAVNLPDGTLVLDDVPGVPFRLTVKKTSDRPTGVYFARLESEDTTLAERVREQFDRKAMKLEKYQTTGTTTVLLIENDDIALMNDSRLLEAIRAAYPNGLPIGVNEVWYADTSILLENRFRNFTPILTGQSEL